jgi:hypothetical protein
MLACLLVKGTGEKQSWALVAERREEESEDLEM